MGAFVILWVKNSDNAVPTLYRNGLSGGNSDKMSFAEMMKDDALTSREERCYRLWINSHGIATHCNNLFEDVRDG